MRAASPHPRRFHPFPISLKQNYDVKCAQARKKRGFIMAIRLLIIGGVAGGATAAARARRIDENAEIIVFEKGEYVSFANCGLPYYVGGEIADRGGLLVSTPKHFKDRFRIDVRPMCEVIEIGRAEKEIKVLNRNTGETYTERYDKLILSPGAAPVRPSLPGIGLDTVYTIRNIPDADRIKKYVDTKQPAAAVVVGGGFIGLEMAENLARRGVEVTIVEMLDQVMAPLDFEMAALLHEHLIAKGVSLRLKESVKSFREESGRTVVETSGGGIPCDMVILAIGVKPDVALAANAGLEIGERGGIKTNNRMQTSDPDIYAVGDAVEVEDYVGGGPALIPLAGPANKQGRIAADNALGRDSVFKGTQGTAIVRVFGLAAAATGNSVKLLKRKGVPHLVSFTHSGSHADYFPGAHAMAIKLIFAPGTGRILGAQIVGPDGADKRIDVIATAIRAGMTIFDLEELELAYAPQFSSAKDPVNMAGFTAANILRGDVKTINWDDVAGLDPKKYLILDVRGKQELDSLGYIKGAAHIPLNELRGRLGELDRNKTVAAYCATGMRSYIAARILTQRGFDAVNLSGGFRTLSAADKSVCVRK
jgi:NADPH-dependent 2,4-dienoyl-CoA reductase/sulfur reductase-like enzyme/rhodanese-related sulfurtransferase